MASPYKRAKNFGFSVVPFLLNDKGEVWLTMPDHFPGLQLTGSTAVTANDESFLSALERGITAKTGIEKPTAKGNARQLGVGNLIQNNEIIECAYFYAVSIGDKVPEVKIGAFHAPFSLKEPMPKNLLTFQKRAMDLFLENGKLVAHAKTADDPFSIDYGGDDTVCLDGLTDKQIWGLKQWNSNTKVMAKRKTNALERDPFPKFRK